MIDLNRKIRSYLRSLQIITRRRDVEINLFQPKKQSERVRNCIILHGFAADARALGATRQALQNLPQTETYHFWDVTYDTAWTSFATSAAHIKTELFKHDHDFSETFIFGYSMGGLVARALVAEGFPCSALMSIGAPHHGTTPWIPLPIRGPRSLARRSAHTARLNKSTLDREHRDRYHMYSITYDDPFGPHEHDGMIPRSSAEAIRLGPVASRNRLHFSYTIPITAVMGFEPHWRGMFPQYNMPALEKSAKLMAEI